MQHRHMERDQETIVPRGRGIHDTKEDQASQAHKVDPLLCQGVLLPNA